MVNEKKQLKLSNFCDTFDIPIKTAKHWIHTKGFPGYKIGDRWYVDIDSFYVWREKMHQASYKYA